MQDWKIVNSSQYCLSCCTYVFHRCRFVLAFSVAPSQEPREKVSILKFWPLRPIWGRCSPRTLTLRWDIFSINIPTVKVSGNVKNGPRRVFSFRDIKVQTLMRSKKRKMSQKSVKSKNAHFPRKFITGWKWMNFGTMVDGHNGHRISKKSRVGNSCNSFKMFLNFSTLTPNISKKSPWKFFCDFWLNQPSRRWRTRIWPKTGTGSSFRRHFVGKTNFWVFLGIFSARC